MVEQGVRATDRLRRPPIRTVKTVVVKLGGARLLEDALLGQVSALVRGHWEAGERMVLIHGHACDSVGDEEAVLRTRGLLNTTLVGRLVKDGIVAVGLSGVDLGLAHAEGTHGTPTKMWVDGSRLRRLMDEGLVPVLAPVALSPDGRPVRACPDELSHAVAKALGADTLALLGDAPGPAQHVEEPRVRALLERTDLSPELRARLEAARTALKLGVRDVRLGGLE
jgi:acetylglutamate kinase